MDAVTPAVLCELIGRHEALESLADPVHGIAEHGNAQRISQIRACHYDQPATITSHVKWACCRKKRQHKRDLPVPTVEVSRFYRVEFGVAPEDAPGAGIDGQALRFDQLADDDHPLLTTVKNRVPYCSVGVSLVHRCPRAPEHHPESFHD